jgi:hypothetical protein
MAVFFGSFNPDLLEVNKQVALWLIPVGFYLLSYVLFQFLQKIDTPRFIYKILGPITLIGVALFILPIIVLGALTRGPIESSFNFLYLVLLKTSIWGIPLVAMGLSIIIAIGICWGLSVSTRVSKSSKKHSGE